ncbi:hypothetical protein GOQ04_14950 [Emticicia sp. ODNR4P]|nr:hypothetical protein [Emticicia sp. ODNR4P]
MQISEYVTVDVDSLTMKMGNHYEARFNSLEELDKAIDKFHLDCQEFAAKNENYGCSSVIEEACFPSVYKE